ncbi:MAG: hypothetical protein ACREBD_29540 [Blastocatellia bacterium]
MSEERERTTRAYKRAGIGLAVVALLWTASLLFMGLPEDEKTHWLIPIGAAALSVLCFSLYSKSKNS